MMVTKPTGSWLNQLGFVEDIIPSPCREENLAVFVRMADPPKYVTHLCPKDIATHVKRESLIYPYIPYIVTFISLAT